MRRYFPTTALGGRLYVDGMSERAPWDAKRLPYQDGTVAELLVVRAGHRKAQTVEELQVVLRESEEGLPAIRVWVADELEEVARRLWEKSQSSPRVAYVSKPARLSYPVLDLTYAGVIYGRT